MHRLLLLLFLSIPFHLFAQQRQADTLSYSREKGRYITGWIHDSSLKLIKTYTGKSKRNWIQTSYTSLWNHKTEITSAEIKNKQLDGAYTTQIKDSILIIGQYSKGLKSGIWKQEYLVDQTEIISTYNSEGKRIKKDVRSPQSLKIYQSHEVTVHPSIPYKIQGKKDYWHYGQSVDKMYSKMGKKIDFRVLILSSGEVGDIKLMKANSIFSQADIKTISENIYISEGFFPSRINDFAVNSCVKLTFIYQGKDYSEIVFSKLEPD